MGQVVRWTELGQNNSPWQSLLLAMLDRQVLLPNLVFRYPKKHDTCASLKVFRYKSEHSAVVGWKLKPASVCVDVHIYLYWDPSVIKIMSVTSHRREHSM